MPIQRAFLKAAISAINQTQKAGKVTTATMVTRCGNNSGEIFDAEKSDVTAPGNTLRSAGDFHSFPKVSIRQPKICNEVSKWTAFYDNSKTGVVMLPWCFQQPTYLGKKSS